MRRQRGHLRFDRRFSELGVPRLQRSSGTSDQSAFRHLNELLTTVASSDEGAPILQAFAEELISVDELRLAEATAGRKLLAERCRTRLTAHQSYSVNRDAVLAQGEPVPPPAARVESPNILAKILPSRRSDAELVKKQFWETGRQRSTRLFRLSTFATRRSVDTAHPFVRSERSSVRVDSATRISSV
jgi:hypothetical protein